MRTDREMERDVIEELQWEPRVREKGIGVKVSNGVVMLRGSVPTFADKWAAEQAAERVKGVRGVAQELEVQLPSGIEQSDANLVRSAANLLEWNAHVPKDKVKVSAERGTLTLTGTVEHEYQREAAQQAVRNLSGLRGVTNFIRVVPPSVSIASVRSGIEAALQRHALLDANRISVETANGTVTLRGAVHTIAERRVATGAAWSAPGVKDVNDKLVVEA